MVFSIPANHSVVHVNHLMIFMFLNIDVIKKSIECCAIFIFLLLYLALFSLWPWPSIICSDDLLDEDIDEEIDDEDSDESDEDGDEESSKGPAWDKRIQNYYDKGSEEYSDVEDVNDRSFLLSNWAIAYCPNQGDDVPQ